MMFPEPRFCIDLLRGLDEVVEVGGSYHNPYWKVGKVVGRYRNAARNTASWRQYDEQFGGQALTIDIEADALSLPLADDSIDALIASHVIEHVWDPIAAINEWLRVVRPAKNGEHGQHGQPTARGGYVYLVVPHKDRMTDDRSGDRDQDPTTPTELQDRHTGFIAQPGDYPENTSPHRSFWNPLWFGRLLDTLRMPGWGVDYKFGIEAFMERDDNVGNGFVYVLRKLA